MITTHTERHTVTHTQSHTVAQTGVNVHQHTSRVLRVVSQKLHLRHRLRDNMLGVVTRYPRNRH